MIWRPMVMSAITQMLQEVAWGDLDVLVVDMPPGTGDAQLTMAQATPLAGAVIVSTPQDLALIDARRGVSMFKRVEIPILGVVENMATFVCPHCGQSSHFRPWRSKGGGGASRRAVPWRVPLNMTIRELSDSGRPVVVAEPEGPHARIYKDMAQQVWTALSGGAAARPAPRIVVSERTRHEPASSNPRRHPGRRALWRMGGNDKALVPLAGENFTGARD